MLKIESTTYPANYLPPRMVKFAASIPDVVPVVPEWYKRPLSAGEMFSFWDNVDVQRLSLLTKNLNQ